MRSSTSLPFAPFFLGGGPSGRSLEGSSSSSSSISRAFAFAALPVSRGASISVCLREGFAPAWPLLLLFVFSFSRDFAGAAWALPFDAPLVLLLAAAGEG